MATLIAFNNLTIDAVPVTTCEMVNGTGTLTLNSNKGSINNACGQVLPFIITLTPTASVDLKGERLELALEETRQVAIEFLRDAATVYSMNGIVTATYNDSSKVTSLTITGEPSE